MMTIHLPKDVESSINAEVMRGNFASTDDALAAAWRAFRQTKLARKRAGKKSPAPATQKNLLTEAIAAHNSASELGSQPALLRPALRRLIRALSRARAQPRRKNPEKIDQKELENWREMALFRRAKRQFSAISTADHRHQSDSNRGRHGDSMAGTLIGADPR